MNPQQTKDRQNTLPPPVQLFEIATGFMKSQAIYVAAKLGIADLLKEGVSEVTELAKITGTDRNSLFRLLRALASIGIFAEKDSGVFELTPMAAALQSDIPMSLRPYVMLLGDQSWWDSWGSLLHSVKTGEAAFDHLFGMDYTEYLEKHPDLAQIFNETMTSVSRAHNPAIISSYDFSGFQKIVDVGGGHGSLFTEILKANPSLRGILFDLPHVVNSIDQLDAEISQRCEIFGGDFLKEVPTGGDAYLLKQIIHDWDDERSLKILKNCHQAMLQNGRILVIDAILEPGNEPNITKFFDLHMLVTAPGGKERTESEFRLLFKEAGFEVSRIIPTASTFFIIEGHKK